MVIITDDLDAIDLRPLTAMAHLPDEQINPAEAALLFAALDHPGLTLGSYRSHLRQLAEDCAATHAQMLQNGQDDTAETRLNALRVTLFSDHGYSGDNEDYNNLDNADLIRVIDRRRGMPIALTILYIATARALGWTAYGLAIPGHFLARLDHESQRIIFDPFHGGQSMNAADIRAQLKSVLGPDAELSADYYNPASNRDLLLRLQNNRKIRLIEAEDYEGALTVVKGLRAFVPAEYRLLLDEGVLSARTGRNQAAIRALEAYIKAAPDPQDRHEAALLLSEIKRGLN
jgi:regulator of sirC expression with transglutaminase-like and TPR domain